MGTSEEITIEAKQEQSLGGLVLITALKTLKWLLIVFALATTLFCCLFPYQTMDVYRSLGNNRAALRYCDVCVRRAAPDSDELSSLLVTAINLSSSVLDDTLDNEQSATNNVKSDAEKVNTYTSSYLNLSEKVMDKRSSAIDDYNLRNIAKISHPIIYNFTAYVYAQKVYTGTISGNTDISKLVTDAVDETNIANKIILLCGVNSYLKAQPLLPNAYAGLDITALSAQTRNTLADIQTGNLSDVAQLHGVRTLMLLGGYATIAANAVGDKTMKDSAEYMTMANDDLKLSAYYQQILNNYCK